MKLSNEEVKKIEEEVKKAEQKTQGEIVPVILSACDDYKVTNYYLALFLTFIGAVCFYILEIDSVYLLPLLTVAALFGYFMAEVSAIKRFLTGDEMIAQEVHEKTMSLFLENNLHHTEGRNGIIVMVSLLEHRVEILADKGINDKIDPEKWSEICQKLISQIKSNKLADGVREAIRDCGEILEAHFPSQDENPNELPNKLITDLF